MGRPHWEPEWSLVIGGRGWVVWAYVSLFCIDNPSNGATLVDGCIRDRVTQLWFLHGTEITEHTGWWGGKYKR